MKGVECRVHLKSLNPRPRVRGLQRLSPADKAIHEEMTGGMLKNGVIEFADSEWSAGVVLAKKKGTDKKRYAVDLRGLNEEAIGNAIGVPRLDDLLENWARARWLSTWDAASAFWSIPIRSEDRKYFAYHAWYEGRYQQFQFKVMPYGFKMASSIYQTAYSKILRGLKHCTCYIDDGVQATMEDDFEAHLVDLAKVFCRLEANNIYVKMPKCLWATKEMPALGHLCLAGKGIAPDPHKVEALANMEPPNSIALLKSLLGAAGYLSKFVAEYAGLIQPLRKMDDGRHKSAPIEGGEWGEKQLKAFWALKAALCTSPVLAAPAFSRPWIILTDCSGTQMGACLAQLDSEGIERPIAYASASLSEAQKNYTISEAEGLAVAWAVRKWRHYVHGSSALVITDHSCLKNLTTDKVFENTRLNRYAVELSEHNLKVIY
jgi:hypothetical protein